MTIILPMDVVSGCIFLRKTKSTKFKGEQYHLFLLIQASQTKECSCVNAMRNTNSTDHWIMLQPQTK